LVFVFDTQAPHFGANPGFASTLWKVARNRDGHFYQALAAAGDQESSRQNVRRSIELGLEHGLWEFQE
jgi:hypothetical protein